MLRRHLKGAQNINGNHRDRETHLSFVSGVNFRVLNRLIINVFELLEMGCVIGDFVVLAASAAMGPSPQLGAASQLQCRRCSPHDVQAANELRMRETARILPGSGTSELGMTSTLSYSSYKVGNLFFGSLLPKPS